MRLRSKKRALARAIKKGLQSNAVKSTRRIHFTHLDETCENRGYFHADYFFGNGSCILVKIRRNFFLLTARHVLESNHIKPPYQNESPFWVDVRNGQARTSSLDEWFMPAKLWNITELMSTEVVSSFVFINDLVLIELFPPNKNYLPDNVIDLSKESDVLAKQQLSEGLLLVASGYPKKLNVYHYDSPPEGFTHNTITQRQVAVGVYREEGEFGYISFEESEFNCSSDTATGMSGGAVTNIELNQNDTKLVGLIVSGGENIIRFIPAYLFINAVLNYEFATSEVIDPILEVSLFEQIMSLNAEERVTFAKCCLTRAK